MNKSDLIDWIISHQNFDGSTTRENLEAMTKPLLINLAKEVESMDKIIEDLDVPEDAGEMDILESFNINNLQLEDPEENNPEIELPSIVTRSNFTSPTQIGPEDRGWTDYVMGLLEGNEVFSKDGRSFPTANGLRRVFTQLISRHYSSETQILQVPSPENDGRATVVVTLKFVPNGTRYPISMSGSADIFFGNTEPPFCNFPIATAETIAEGRAFKKALCLNATTADEMRGISERSKDAIYGNGRVESNENDLADPERINLICRLCNQNEIDVKKMIKLHIGENASVDTLTQVEGQKIIRIVNDYNRKIVPIPDEILAK